MSLTLLLALQGQALASPQYYDLGVTAGAPGGINGTFGYWFDHYGVRASAGYLVYSSGAQLSALYRFGPAGPRKHSHSVGLTVGHFELDREHLNYIGPVWEMDLSFGLYVQAGLAPATDQAVFPTLSVGYVKRVHKGKRR